MPGFGARLLKGSQPPVCGSTQHRLVWRQADALAACEDPRLTTARTDCGGVHRHLASPAYRSPNRAWSHRPAATGPEARLSWSPSRPHGWSGTTEHAYLSESQGCGLACPHRAFAHRVSDVSENASASRAADPGYPAEVDMNLSTLVGGTVCADRRPGGFTDLCRGRDLRLQDLYRYPSASRDRPKVGFNASHRLTT